MKRNFYNTPLQQNFRLHWMLYCTYRVCLSKIYYFGRLYDRKNMNILLQDARFATEIYSNWISLVFFGVLCMYCHIMFWIVVIGVFIFDLYEFWFFFKPRPVSTVSWLYSFHDAIFRLVILMCRNQNLYALMRQETTTKKYFYKSYFCRENSSMPW